jgi:hypothetical protein
VTPSLTEYFTPLRRRYLADEEFHDRVHVILYRLVAELPNADLPRLWDTALLIADDLFPASDR